MTISISKLRETLREVLRQVQEGARVDITLRGKVIATIGPPEASSDDIDHLLKEIRSQTKIQGDIVNSPMKDYDLLTEDLQHNIAAEPEENV